MACKDLGVLFDTCVFVPCLLQAPNYPAELLRIVRDEALYIVVCAETVQEYVEIANRDYVKSGPIIRQMLDNLCREGIHRYAEYNSEATIRVKNRKDQIMVDCAANGSNRAHIVVTMATQMEHFSIIQAGNEHITIIPLAHFLNHNQLETTCRDCKRNR